MSSARAPGDHFSGVSAAYSAFRPRYPHALFEFLATLTPRHRLAWDCGAGTGQATVDLAEFFDRVIGTDVSAEQIARAPAHPKITWLVSPAESAPLASGSVDLITVAQALHWFDHARFNAEVQRVAAPSAAVAAWTYAAPQMDGGVGDVLQHFMLETLGPYWPPERRYVDDEYRSIPISLRSNADAVAGARGALGSRAGRGLHAYLVGIDTISCRSRRRPCHSRRGRAGRGVGRCHEAEKNQMAIDRHCRARYPMSVERICLSR